MYIVSTVKGFTHTFAVLRDAKACASTASHVFHCDSHVMDGDTGEILALYNNGHPVD